MIAENIWLKHCAYYNAYNNLGENNKLEIIKVYILPALIY